MRNLNQWRLTLTRLRQLVNAWRRGIVFDGGRPVILGIAVAGFTFIVAYGSGALARAHVPEVGTVSAWFSLGLFEHARSVSYLELVPLLAFIVVPLFGWVPLVTVHNHWWRQRQWAVIVAGGVLSGGALANLADLLQRGAVTDFLVIRNLGDFSAGDVLIILGSGGLLVVSAPDQVAVTNRNIVAAVGAILLGLIALPLIRPPLNHLVPLAVLLAGAVWLAKYLLWRVRTGNQLLATLARDVPTDPGPEADRVFRDLELALRSNLHVDLAASRMALAKLANGYAQLERRDDLRRIADEYLRMAEELESDRMKEWAFHFLGLAASLGGEWVQATRLWHQALQLAEEQHDDRHKLRLLINVAWAEGQLGKQHDSQRTYSTALDLAERLGDAEAVFHLRNAIGSDESA